MIKEVILDDEKIIIEFDGARFWKYYVIQVFLFVRIRKWLVNYTESNQYHFFRGKHSGCFDDRDWDGDKV